MINTRWHGVRCLSTLPPGSHGQAGIKHSIKTLCGLRVVRELES
jgi:hypothetical protein